MVKNPRISSLCGPVNRVTGSLGYNAPPSLETKLAPANSRVFQCMFKVSEITKKTTCRKDKVSYLCTFGLGPYFLQQIKDKMTRSNGFVLMFDESLSRDLDKEQMDLHFRMWNMDKVRSENS
ncbi:peptidase m20 domain-containing protein 2 [Plakobranchus ocellatus]|uniref:Peptidase m20 domain-containing protein 2 n=1 Tax=Plakobranchus ocellatus TaxID=259542 RepID=A0AAV4ABJ0_9GAST|nr:peptidase m20 domain-containing protein 2 [Plakobranchus ocellatus]